MLQPVRGTKDLLPQDFRNQNHVVTIAKEICETFGFQEMSTPIFEFTKVFSPVGETSDIISKETYTFEDRNGESLTLRPEGTAAVMRSVISNGLTQNTPLKFFYAGPMFRYDRPQKGRYRQFTQIGVELVGPTQPQADVEVIAAAYEILKKLNLSDSVTLEINSLGDKESREAYRSVLVEYLEAQKNDLSEESQDRLTRNPLRILDSKDKGDQKIIEGAPSYSDSLNQVSRDFFTQVCEGLKLLNIPYTVNPKLVRGLDYYCHTAFEFISTELGAQGTVLAGGRYDGLVKSLGGPDLAGIGWAGGVERLALLSQLSLPASRPIAVIPIGDGEIEEMAMKVSHMLRQLGHYVEQGYSGNLSKRMKKANQVNATHAILIGEDEVKTDSFLVRDLDRGTEDKVPLDSLTTYFNSKRDSYESERQTRSSAHSS